MNVIMFRRSEKDLDAAVMKALDQMGWFVVRLQQPRATKQTEGTPDLYAMHPVWQLAVWIELKRSDSTLSLHQRFWHAMARESGVPVLVVRSTHDLVEGLRQLGAPI